MGIIDLIVLILIFQVKHFLADYLLQGKYMLGKFKENGWELPLLAHSGVHMGLTYIILAHYLPWQYALGLATADLCIHFLIDRVKVLASAKYDSKVDKEFWWWLGADQMAHHVTHYAIVFITFSLVNGGL